MLRLGLFTLLATLLVTIAYAQKGRRCCVVYYSQNGTTAELAKLFAAEMKADLLRIEVADAYPDTYAATVKRAMCEKSEGILPTLLPLQKNLQDYDIIFLGYPIWFGNYARPIMALLASTDLSGKTIVPFCAYGIGGKDMSFDNLRAALPHSKVLPGYGTRRTRVKGCAHEVANFLKEQGLKRGKILAMPPYSEPQSLTDYERTIYTQAATTYERDLGIPLKVAKRENAERAEYRFTVKGKSKKGETVEREVYVVVDKRLGTPPEIVYLSRE